MSAQANVLSSGRTQVSSISPTHSGWIVSARDDLVWFIGSAAAGYLFWALWRYSPIPLTWLVAAWAVIFDETHGYATWSRTVLDSEERARRGNLFWKSFLFFFAIGPVLLLLHLGNVLEFVTLLWGYFHIYRQHYGFLMMYKTKNGDFNKTDLKLDKIFFTTAFYYPFLTSPVYSKETMEEVPFVLPATLWKIWAEVLLAATLAMTLIYLGRQIQKWRHGQSLNWPKQLLFLAAIPINVFIFRTSLPIVGVYAAVTIFHNIQYHRLVWFYNRNKYGTGATHANPVRRYGLASFANRNLLIYAAFAFLYACLFDVLPRFILPPWTGPQEATIRNQLLFSLFAAPGLLHYWLDSKIWKVGRDPELRRYLKIDAA
jgi:hypothetical protein